MSDWIDDFVDWTVDVNSPEIFKLWGGIAAVAGALQRRVWLTTRQGSIYPNLYTFLVASPGIGKSEIIKKVNELWATNKKIFIAPDNVTKASLIDELTKCATKITVNSSSLLEFNSLAVCSSEWGVLCPTYDLEFLNALNNIFDNPKNYRETRRTMNKDIDIPYPQINLLTGTQPKFLASTMPDEAWGTGFTARIIMIYAGAAPIKPLFGETNYDPALGKSLASRIAKMEKMIGQVTLTQHAMDALTDWHLGGRKPEPTHSRLANYLPRRILHVLKLCIISCISRGEGTEVTIADVERAKHWLINAESLMPNIFREMSGKSDSSILQEMHEFLWRIFAKNRNPIPENVVYDFLMDFTVTDKIPRIIDVAEKSGLIIKTISNSGVTMYSPRPKKTPGMPE